MRRLLRYLAPRRWQVVAAIVITVVVSALGPLRPYLTMLAIDKYIAKNDMNGLLTIMAMIVGTIVLQSIVLYGQALLTAWIGQQTVLDLRRELFAHLHTLAMRFFDRNPVGRLVTRLTNDVEVLNELFSSGIIMIVADVFVVFWIFVFMFYTSWKLSLVVLTVFPLLLVATSI